MIRHNLVKGMVMPLVGMMCSVDDIFTKACAKLNNQSAHCANTTNRL